MESLKIIQMNETTFYVFNENGMINESALDEFCTSFLKRTSFDFELKEKIDIGPLSTIYKKFINKKLEFTLFDHGYVLKVEGEIKSAINLLVEVDSILQPDVIYYISPSQRIENSKEFLFPRGMNEKDIAVFLDKKFRNNEYTKALSNY